MDKFVLQVPKWQGELLFSKEIIVFLGVILLMIVGTLFCFWGYKYFRTVLFLGIGAIVCYGSYLLVESMTDNLVIRMFLTVSLTFLGMCFAYFIDIVFCYILDRFGIRSALGKRTYLISAPLGAAILGLTIYFGIWRDAVVALGIALCLLVPGFIFQHHKRKEMVRFRCYNDLLRLGRPEFDEDGLELLSLENVGMASLAAAAPALSEKSGPEPEPILEATPEPEPILEATPEPEPILEAIPEPEPKPILGAEPTLEPVAEFELEPLFVMNAGQRALLEIESEFASKREYGSGELSELVEAEAKEPAMPVTETVAIAEEPATVEETAEAGSEPVPIEISDNVRELILRKMETDEELLEEAFFVKRMNRKMAAANKKDDEEIHIERISPVYPGKITITKKDRKSRRKREEGMAKGAAIAAAGLGAFLVGRITKGGD